MSSEMTSTTADVTTRYKNGRELEDTPIVVLVVVVASFMATASSFEPQLPT